MSIVISDEMLQSTQLTADEFLHEIALLFYQQKRLTLAQAAALAQVDRLSFQQLLASRDIALHYDEQDLQTDLETLKKLKLL
jgi:predicted HTH domain antitoxin